MSDMPAYMRIRHYVVDLVLSHADPETRIMSERELCKAFSVTRPTARKAIKELVDDGWIVARPGFGSFVNPAYSRNNLHRLLKLRKILVIINDGKLVEYDSFYMNILARVCDSLRALEARLKMPNLTGNPAKAAEELAAYNPDGILWVTPSDSYMEAIEEIRKRVPVHILYRAGGGGKDATTIDYRAAGGLAAAWLLDHGRRRLAFIGHKKGSPTMRLILDGWLQEFKRRGLGFEPSLRIDFDEDISEKAEGLLRSASVDGVFCYGYVYAFFDRALSSSKASRKSLKILIDKYRYPENAIASKPDAELLLHPDELIDIAARRLHESIANGGVQARELILTPRILQSADGG